MFVHGAGLLAFLGLAQAHMHLHYPPTLLGDNNPYTPTNGANHLLNYPYGCCGPENQAIKDLCKGHLGLLDKPEGKSVVTWTAGQTANFSVSGLKITNTDATGDDVNPLGGTHAGGSAQIGLSMDRGKTFRVVKTWQGNFPDHDKAESRDPDDHTYKFTIPADTPSGPAVFAWTWINREQEFNMNCASVTIAGAGEAPQEPQPPTDDDDEAEQQQPSNDENEQQPPNNVEEPQEQPSYERYTLGCTCLCPSQIWTKGCTCDDCGPRHRRHAEREALALHKRKLQRAEALKAPLRRAEAAAFASRPLMSFDIDIEREGSRCTSPGDPYELRFPNPGPDVEEKPGNDGYKLVEPNCN